MASIFSVSQAASRTASEPRGQRSGQLRGAFAGRAAGYPNRHPTCRPRRALLLPRWATRPLSKLYNHKPLPCGLGVQASAPSMWASAPQTRSSFRWSRAGSGARSRARVARDLCVYLRGNPLLALPLSTGVRRGSRESEGRRIRQRRRGRWRVQRPAPWAGPGNSREAARAFSRLTLQLGPDGVDVGEGLLEVARGQRPEVVGTAPRHRHRGPPGGRA